MIKRNEEILVCRIINNNFSDLDKASRLFSIAEDLAREIKKDIQNIKKCKHIGSNFIERGDLVYQRFE